MNMSVLETDYGEIASDVSSVQKLLTKRPLHWYNGFFLTGKHPLLQPLITISRVPWLDNLRAVAEKQRPLVSEPCAMTKLLAAAMHYSAVHDMADSMVLIALRLRMGSAIELKLVPRPFMQTAWHSTCLCG